MVFIFDFLKKKKEKSRFQEKIQSEKKKMYLFSASEKSTITKRKKKILSKAIQILRSKNLKNYLIYFYIFIICGGVFGSVFVIYGPIFKVQKIEIIRKDDISDINIAYRSIEDYRGKLIFSIDSKKLAEDLKSYQKNISDIVVGKILPHSLKITIGSYPGVYQSFLGGKEYMISENGVIIPKTGTGNLQKLLFTPPNQTVSGIIEYKQVFNPLFIEKIQNLEKGIKDNLLNIIFGDMYYFPKERELHIIVGKETKLIFDLNGDIQEQIERLVIFNKENLALKNPGILYIDLRIKNKVFFCTTETEFDCRKTLSYYYQY